MGDATIHDVTERIWSRQIQEAWSYGYTAWAPDGANPVHWRSIARRVARRAGYHVRTFVLPLPDAPDQAGATAENSRRAASEAVHPAGKHWG